MLRPDLHKALDTKPGHLTRFESLGFTGESQCHQLSGTSVCLGGGRAVGNSALVTYFSFSKTHLCFCVSFLDVHHYTCKSRCVFSALATSQLVQFAHKSAAMNKACVLNWRWSCTVSSPLRFCRQADVGGTRCDFPAPQVTPARNVCCDPIAKCCALSQDSFL